MTKLIDILCNFDTKTIVLDKVFKYCKPHLLIRAFDKDIKGGVLGCWLISNRDNGWQLPS